MPDDLVLEISPTLLFVSIKTGQPHTSQGLPHEAWGDNEGCTRLQGKLDGYEIRSVESKHAVIDSMYSSNF
jgi:hypothetical protein